MVTLFLFITLMLLFLAYDNQGFAFSLAFYSKEIRSGLSFNLKDIKASIVLKVAPVVAAAGKVVGGAAGGGGGFGSILGKAGGMMGGGGKGGGGGQQGGGMMSSLVNGATKPMRATMGLATGAIQGIQAMRLKKKADAAFPELVDPNQAGYMAELNQKRKSIETGADFSEGMQAIDTTNAATNDALTRVTGGDVGGTIQALLQSERAAGDSKNRVLAQGQAQQMNYDQAYGNILDQIAGRKLQLQMARSQQLRAEWDRKSKLASANLQAGMAGLVPGGNSNPQPAAQLGGGAGGNGLNVSDMMQMVPKANTGLSNVPSAPSSAPVSAPKVTPAVTETAKGLGPVMSLISK